MVDQHSSTCGANKRNLQVHLQPMLDAQLPRLPDYTGWHADIP